MIDDCIPEEIVHIEHERPNSKVELTRDVIRLIGKIEIILSRIERVVCREISHFVVLLRTERKRTITLRSTLKSEGENKTKKQTDNFHSMVLARAIYKIYAYLAHTNS